MFPAAMRRPVNDPSRPAPEAPLPASVGLTQGLALPSAGLLDREKRQRRKSGGRQPESAGLATKVDTVERGVSDSPAARTLLEGRGAALKLPPHASIGLASGADCVDAFIMWSMSDMAVPSVARWPCESERPTPGSAMPFDRSKSRRMSDSETTQPALAREWRNDRRGIFSPLSLKPDWNSRPLRQGCVDRAGFRGRLSPRIGRACDGGKTAGSQDKSRSSAVGLYPLTSRRRSLGKYAEAAPRRMCRI